MKKKGVFEDAVQQMTAEKNPPKKKKLAKTTRAVLNDHFLFGTTWFNQQSARVQLIGLI